MPDDYFRQNNLRHHHESLLVSEDENGLQVSLYLSADVLSHLADSHPNGLLEAGKFSEFCLILEGVSHFLYLVWNARYQKQITLLELELQAEIDKFIVLMDSLSEENNNGLADELHSWLFEKHRFSEALSGKEYERYQQANHYAGKYCMGLQQQYRLTEQNDELMKELRRFYRMDQAAKLRTINRLN